MTLNITLNGDVTLDESAGLQVGGVGTPTEDNDDDDVTLATLQSDAPAFYNRLFSGGQLNLSTTFPTLIGVAESQDDLISVSSDTPLTDISFSFTEGGPTGLSTLDGNQIFYYADPTDSNILLLREGSGATPDQNGDIVAALYLDIDTTSLTTADVKLWIVQFESLLNTNTSDHDDALQLQNLSIGASSELSFDFDEVKSGNFYFIMYGETDGAVLVTSSDPDNLPTNTSQGGIGATIGVASQMTGAGEALVFTYIDQVPTSDLLNTPANPNLWKSESNIDYGGLINGTGGSVTVSQTQGSGPASLTLEAYSTAIETGSTNPDYSDGLITNDASVSITSIQIVETIPGDFTASAQFSSGTWTVTGLEAGDVIKYTTDGLHNRLVVAHADIQDANANFDIGAVSILQSSSDTVALNNIFFEDDGPDAVVTNSTPDMLLLDESPVPATGDGIVSVTANYADNFSGTTDFGTDGAGSALFSLDLSGSNIGSGLYALDTSDTQGVGGDGDGIGQGDEILLNQSGNTVTGSAGGTDFFTISINPNTGIVTFTQLNNIWHSNTANHDDQEILTLSGGDYLRVVQTVTDADGDSDSAFIDVSTGVFKIEDDGPDSVVSNSTPDMLLLDESPLPAIGDGIASATANLADNFATPTDFGTDGAGSALFSLDLSGANVGSGLYALDPADTQDVGGDGDGIGQGNEILLNQSGNTITGSAGGTDYFTISIDPNTGIITFAQQNNIWHSNTANHDDQEVLTLTGGDYLHVVQTIIDGDGDSDSEFIDLSTGVFKIEDDGPSLTLSIKQGAEIRLDETDNDADDGDVGGFLANVTVTGAVLFSSTPTFGTDGAGSTNYSLSISSEGADSGLLDSQTDQAVLLYTDGSDIVGRINVMGSDLEVLRISINSSSGDTTVKQSRAVEHDDTTDPDESTSPEVLDPNVLFVNRTIVDADGDSANQQVDLGPIIKIEDSGPTMTSAQNLVIDNVVNDMESGTLGFDTGSDIDGIFAITDATKTASLDWNFADVDGDTQVGNNEIIGTLDGDDLYSLIINDDGSYKFTLLGELESEVVMLDVEDIKAGGPDTNFIDVGALGSSAFVRITGIGGAINESNENVGVKNGNLDANEGLIFEYFENNMVEPISSLSIGTKTAQTVTYSFEAEFEGQVVFSGTQVVEKNGTLLIEGMNDQLFDKVTIENLDGNAVKIGLEDIKIETPPDDVVLAFDVSHTDSDGDSATLAVADLDNDSDNDTFKVSIDADGDNMIT